MNNKPRHYVERLPPVQQRRFYASTIAFQIKICRWARMYGSATTPCNQSRNKREGAYVGKYTGRHYRTARRLPITFLPWPRAYGGGAFMVAVARARNKS